MSATDTRVGERLAQGMNITEATREGDAESNKMVDRDEDYNTRYGGYAGNLLAFKRTKLIPRKPAAIDLTAMVAAAHADTVDEVVDHLRPPLRQRSAGGQGSSAAGRLPAGQARLVRRASERDAGIVAARVVVSRIEYARVPAWIAVRYGLGSVHRCDVIRVGRSLRCLWLDTRAASVHAATSSLEGCTASVSARDCRSS